MSTLTPFREGGRLSGVVEGGVELGKSLPGVYAKSTWCYYIPITEKIVDCACK